MSLRVQTWLCGAGLLLGWLAATSLTLQVSLQGDPFGQTRITTIMTALCIIGMGGCAGACLLVERVILARLKCLNRQVRLLRPIGAGDDSTRRVLVQGNDEIGALARGINQMLDPIEQSQTALREGAEQYRNLVERANDGIVIIQDGGVRYANPRVIELWGGAEAQVIGTPFTNYIAPVSLPVVLERYQRRMAGEEVAPIYEAVLQRKDGTLLVAELSAGFTVYQGKPADLVIIRDLTERNRVEEALRRSQKEWQDIFNAISHPTFVLDLQHGISAANSAVLMRLGLPEAQVIGRRCYHLFHNADCAPQGCPMEAMLRSGKTETVEMEMQAAGGTYLVSCTPVLDDCGRTEKVIHIATEITERKRAEEELHRSRALLSEAQRIAHLGSWELDLIANNLTWSDEVYRIFGLQPQEFGATYEAFLERVHPDDRAAVDTAYSGSVRDSKDTYEIEHRVAKKDTGEIRRVHEKCIHLKDATGKIIRSIGMVHDITERKRAEAALKEYAEHLEQMVDARTRELRDTQEQLIQQERLAVLGQLAGGVAHELRSPLSAIKNAAYYFKMVVPNPSPDAREMMDILDQQIDVSARIIGGLLDFARPKTPNLQPARLTRVFEAALCQCVIPHNISVSWQADADLPDIQVDVEQMQLVFSNLITNAVQAMPEGGKLTITTQATADEMRVIFSDTGVGIAAESLDRVFQPLYTTKAKGIGLGLALSKIIIEAHAGTIAVESQVGKGTTFAICLPRPGGQT